MRPIRVPWRILLLVFASCLPGNVAWGESVALLADEAQAKAARVELIQSATRRLDVAYYTIADDAVGRLFTGLLVEAAHRGVCVRLIVDSMQHDLARDQIERLRRAGVQIKEFHRPHPPVVRTYTRRMHDKFLARDCCEMIVGNRNLAQSHFGGYTGECVSFVDVDVRVCGAVVGCACHRYFDPLWQSKHVRPLKVKRFGEKKLCSRRGACCTGCPAGQPPVAHEVDCCCLRYFHAPAGDKDRHRDSRSAVYPLLRGARHSILLEAAYFLPTGELKEILHEALGRGVRVTILTNSAQSTDHLLVYAALLDVIDPLLSRGAEIWEYRGRKTLHAKAFVVDGEVACVTSFNFDPRSARLNTENGVIVRDAAVARDLQAIIESHLMMARPISVPPRRPLLPARTSRELPALRLVSRLIRRQL